MAGGGALAEKAQDVGGDALDHGGFADAAGVTAGAVVEGAVAQAGAGEGPGRGVGDPEPDTERGRLGRTCRSTGLAAKKTMLAPWS